MKILFLGDIVSKPGRKTVKKLLPDLRNVHNIDLVFANAENLAGGRGATQNTLYQMMEAGVDYFTSGNHIFYQDGWKDLLSDETYRLLRPANYPHDVPGRGTVVVDDANNKKVLLINLHGQTSFGDSESSVSNPFTALDSILEHYTSNNLDGIIIDFHAEATSEKRAFGFYADGRVSGVIGTHTHVPTADTSILPKGTGYVTDAGMVGSAHSVLGVKKEIIWNRFIYPYPQRFEWVKKGPSVFNSVLVEIEGKEKAARIQRIDRNLDSADT